MRKDSCLNKQHCNNYSIIQIKKEGEKRKQSVSEYKVKSFSHVWLFVTPWIVAYQAPLSMEFSRQKYWSGLPFPSPGDLPNPEIKPRSPTSQADALPSEPPGKPCIRACSSAVPATKSELLNRALGSPLSASHPAWHQQLPPLGSSRAGEGLE